MIPPNQSLDPLEALDYIDPAALHYKDWIAVGMGLKQAGFPVSVWEDWSRRDPARYHDGECKRKWNSFYGSNNPVTAGTIILMALSRGWRPASARAGEYKGRELDWEDLISGLDSEGPYRVTDHGLLEDCTISEPKEWNPADQLIRYLQAVFEPDDIVGYVTRSFHSDGRQIPQKGCWDRSSGELIEGLRRAKGDIGAVIGDSDPCAGAWIRFNPLDGKGIKNENVVAFRYALVESDSIAIAEQNAMIRELELPVAALVHSGGKSLHAIVRIEADSYEEYRRRVDFLYSVCQKNGFQIDRQNRNPSRLSRMPGVMRNGCKQFLVATNIGKASWQEWREWIESVTDDLPEFESETNDVPALSPDLIGGVLREGHKMLLAGPSKAGKSFMLIELAVCISEGIPWLGFPCKQGRSLYVNLELDRATCLNRFRDVRQAMGIPLTQYTTDIWNLRGHAVPMDKLAPKLIRRAKRKGYIAIILDPIYKVITGDENSADQMARFCNQFDKVCNELGCAVIYCHHHSKGLQGAKRSMDRASGSGVFARDPDAILDLIELPISGELRSRLVNQAVSSAVADTFARVGKQFDRDALKSANSAMDYAREVLDQQQYQRAFEAANAARAAAEASTAWRIEGTLREFPKFKPVGVWFDYPVHRLDSSGVLGDVLPESDAPAWARQKDPKAEKRDRRQERLNLLEAAFAFLDKEKTGKVPLSDLMQYTGLTKNTVRNYVDEHPDFQRDNGFVLWASNQGSN